MLKYMEKSNLKLTIVAIVSFLVCGTLPIVGYGLKGNNKPTEESKSWMKNVDGSKGLDEISMPGTHDSGATKSIADVSGKCQDLSIKNQLEIGVRFLDIRLQQVNDEFAVCHEFINQDLPFDDVVYDCYSFLKENPSETIIMSIKEEQDPVNSTLPFTEALKTKLDKYSEAMYYGNEIPTLDEVRGKIFFLSRFLSNSFGVDAKHGWSANCDNNYNTFDIKNDAHLHIQDFYHFKNIDYKKEEVRKCLEYTSSYTTSEDRILSLNYLSGYLDDTFPPAYSIPVAKEMNKWAMDNLKDYSSTGVTIFDFVNKDLAKEVWSKNI